MLNLKSLNDYIKIDHFKIHGLEEILKLVEKKYYMAFLNIKDACYSISVEENFQKYHKFFTKGKLYKFCVLPNGFSPYPSLFTKILKPRSTELR